MATPPEIPDYVRSTISKYLPIRADWVFDCLQKRNGAAILGRELPKFFVPSDYLGPPNSSTAHIVWDTIGKYYLSQNRFLEALNINLSEYQQMIKAQEETEVRIHKGTPLCWASDSFNKTAQIVLAKRYLMLTLCEDAISGKGEISPDETGVYFRLNWLMGMSDLDIQKYTSEIWKLAKKFPRESFFPEWILQRLDSDWMTEFPTSSELSTYIVNTVYVQKLISLLGDPSGITLERLAEYVLSCIPGCRVRCRQRTGSTDLDVVGTLEGNFFDYRSALDRYFVCECKDWKKPANVTIVYKFTGVLDSMKTNFGILFSKNGITGKGKFRDADRELVKIYQRHGILIIVISKRDLEYVANGGNLITMIRNKYEEIRLDFHTLD